MVVNSTASFFAGDGEQAGGLVAVEADVGVCQIAHEDEAVFARELHGIDVEFFFHRYGRWIVRVVQYDQLRPRVDVLADVVDVGEELVVVGDFQCDGVARGQ